MLATPWYHIPHWVLTELSSFMRSSPFLFFLVVSYFSIIVDSYHHKTYLYVSTKIVSKCVQDYLLNIDYTQNVLNAVPYILLLFFCFRGVAVNEEGYIFVGTSGKNKLQNCNILITISNYKVFCITTIYSSEPFPDFVFFLTILLLCYQYIHTTCVCSQLLFPFIFLWVPAEFIDMN